VKRKLLWSLMVGTGLLTAAAGSARAEEGQPAERPDAPWFVKRYDKDGDGKISPEERQAAKDEWQKKREQRALKNFDKDGDGKMSPEEWAAFEQSEKDHKQQLLQKFDKDGDGKLSKTEWAEARKAHQVPESIGKDAGSGKKDVEKKDADKGDDDKDDDDKGGGDKN
jgi:Ca2+-binding EF-hand superfamily protein